MFVRVLNGIRTINTAQIVWILRPPESGAVKMPSSTSTDAEFTCEYLWQLRMGDGQDLYLSEEDYALVAEAIEKTQGLL